MLLGYTSQNYTVMGVSLRMLIRHCNACRALRAHTDADDELHVRMHVSLQLQPGEPATHQW